jgi:Alw26I/Eco31I/Esp3I family type II restriction m6 adenine DNA methyltransferase
MLSIYYQLSPRDFPIGMNLRMPLRIVAFGRGREVDETGSSKWLTSNDDKLLKFVKGRMIERYNIREYPSQGVARPGWDPPASTNYPRIAWRDVSRPSQKRRIIATIIPAGWAAGNSLGVAFFRDNNMTALKALLGIMNSTTFEFQLRAYLATGHISLSSLRKVSVPPLETLQTEIFLAKIVDDILHATYKNKLIADAYIARNIYGLTEQEYDSVLNLFTKMTNEERLGYLKAYQATI